jgi:crotonobetaine/carnitine-CoA ligase
VSAERATFAARWREAVSAVPDDVFLVFEDSAERATQWTYSAFDAKVRGVEAALQARGVRPGGRIHLVLRNSPAFVAIWLAAAEMGACIVPSDPQSSARELGIHMDRTTPRLVVCGAASAEECAQAASERGVPLVAVDEDDVAVSSLSQTPAPSDQMAAPSGLDPLAIMFTSGTTSAPKGVVVTQANYAFAGEVMAAAAGLHRGDRQLVVLPLFHANAQYYSFASAISVGASVALMSSFSASRFLEQAALHQATHASLFAAPMRMILARGAEPVAGLQLRHCWYAQNLTGEQYAALTTLFGCRPRQLYGMTETIPAVLSDRALSPLADSMGFPTLGCEVALPRLEDGGPVEDGAIGEIVVGGRRGVTLFAGYLDDPETTATSFRADVFRTGDRAWRDADGRFHFAGRGGDILKVSGENVSVIEVEAVLSAHPAVFEAAVVGEADPIRDEVPVAYVVLAEGAEPRSIDGLARWCAERLAPSKRPRRIHAVAELPRTSVGKVRKFLLPQLLVAPPGDRRTAVAAVSGVDSAVRPS